MMLALVEIVAHFPDTAQAPDGLGMTRGGPPPHRRRWAALLDDREPLAGGAGLDQVSMPGMVEAATSGALVRITTIDTTSASSAKTTASSKEVEMPWASTWSAYGAGS
jgi:hypothetical protein